MHILVVTLLYAPDGGPSAPLFRLLCEQLSRMGHEVTIIAAVPHYPSGIVQEAYRKGWIQRTVESEVNVIRIRVPSGKRNRLWMRLLQFAIYQLGAAWAGLRLHYDVALVTNPALEVGLPFAVLTVLRRKPSVFWVADLYPLVGIQLGIFRHRPVIAFIDLIERFCLRHAQVIWIFSESFRAELKRMGVPEEKMVLIYSWVDTDFIHPMPRHNAFSTENDLNGCFVVLYAGNIGLSQDWNTLLQAALNLTDQPHFQFVLVGDGSGKEQLQAEIRRLGVSNVRVIPFQPHERIPEVLGTADIALATLQTGIAGGSIPSKIFSYLASGRPLLAMFDLASDACEIVQKSGGGICIPPADAGKITETLQELYQSPKLLEQFSRAGRNYVVESHSVPQIALQVETILQHAINRDTHQ